MPKRLTDITINEISLCEEGMNKGAKVALFKAQMKTEDGKPFPASDFAFVPDRDSPSTWKLRLTSTPGGKPDPRIVGAAVAALGQGFRGQRVQLPQGARSGVVRRVRNAWLTANPDKSRDDLPNVLKAEDNTMTPEQIDELEAKVSKLQEEHDKALEAIEAKDARIAELEKAAKEQEKEQKPDEIDKSKLDPDTLARIEKMEQQAEEDRKAREETEAKLQKMEDQRRDEQITADLRKSFPNVPQVDELLPVFKSLDEEQIKVLRSKLSAGDAAISMGFRELGKQVHDDLDSASNQIQKAAEDLCKSDPSMTIQKARVQARLNNPELARQERQERQH